jgi:hypothetical protein
MDSPEKKLKDYKAAVADAKTKIAQLEGSRGELLKQLDEEFGINSIEAGEKELISIDQDILKLETQIQAVLRKIEDNYAELI